MQFARDAWITLISGFGLVHSQDNPALYPFFLAGCIISLIQGVRLVFAGSLISLARLVNGPLMFLGAVARVVVGSAVYASFLYGLSLLYWLMLLPHVGSLAFCSPSYESTCNVISIVARTIIMLLAVLFVGGDGLALLQLLARPIVALIADVSDEESVLITSLKVLGRVEAFTYIACFAVLFYSWQVVQWPSLAVALVATWFANLITVSLVVVVFAPALVDIVQDRIRALRVKITLATLLNTILLAYVWLYLGVTFDYALLWGIYLLLASLDSIILATASMFNSRRDLDPRFLYPKRFPFVSALITLIALAGASGILGTMFHVSIIPPFVWIAAGAAALAYALFQPLSDEVRAPEYGRSIVRAENDLLARIQKRILAILNIQHLLMRLIIGSTLNVDDGAEQAPTIVDADPHSAGAVVPSSMQSPYGITAQLEEVLPGPRGRGDTRIQNDRRSERDYEKFRKLEFPAYIVFLVALVVYYLLGNLLALPSLIATSPLNLFWHSIPVILGAFSAIASLKLSKRITSFSFHLLIYTLMAMLLLVAANLILSNVARTGSAIGALTPRDTIFWVSLISSFLEAFAIYLIVGHLIYLLRMLNVKATLGNR